MTFAADIRHWATVEDFTQHLTGYDAAMTAPWARGLAYHHTYRPIQSQWTGLASMRGLRDFYIGKNWSAGPHLFICAGAPDPANDGIWQLTPINMVGVHAGACNSSLWGLEIVGDYDKADWSPATRHLAIGAGAALLHWRNLTVTPGTVKGHRDCNSPKTCPGSMVDLARIRFDLLMTTEIAPAPSPAPAHSAFSPILGPPTCTQEQATKYLIGAKHDNYSSADLALTIIPGYWSLCLNVGINPAVPLAQLVKEGSLTSFWGRRPQRNPAGIGVDGTKSKTKPTDTTGWQFNTDRHQWEKGLSFASWINGAIDAHVGRLVAWATEPVQRTEAQRTAVDRALAYRDLALGLHGSATQLRHLGRVHNPSGKGWASPGSDYGEALATIMNAMKGR